MFGGIYHIVHGTEVLATSYYVRDAKEIAKMLSVLYINTKVDINGMTYLYCEGNLIGRVNL